MLNRNCGTDQKILFQKCARCGLLGRRSTLIGSLSTAKIVVAPCCEVPETGIWINVVRIRKDPAWRISKPENVKYPNATRLGWLRAIVSTCASGISCTESNSFCPVSMPDSTGTRSPPRVSLTRDATAISRVMSTLEPSIADSAVGKRRLAMTDVSTSMPKGMTLCGWPMTSSSHFGRTDDFMFDCELDDLRLCPESDLDGVLWLEVLRVRLASRSSAALSFWCLLGAPRSWPASTTLGPWLSYR
jgi:hypothetical protein